MDDDTDPLAGSKDTWWDYVMMIPMAVSILVMVGVLLVIKGVWWIMKKIGG